MNKSYIEMLKKANSNGIEPIKLFVVNEVLNAVVNNCLIDLFSDEELDERVEYLSELIYEMYISGDLKIDDLVNAVFNILAERTDILKFTEKDIKKYL